jgi:hypothetical protein
VEKELTEGSVGPALVEDEVEAGRAGAGFEVATSVGEVDVAGVGLHCYAMMALKVWPSFK